MIGGKKTKHLMICRLETLYNMLQPKLTSGKKKQVSFQNIMKKIKRLIIMQMRL
jgi:hypothetical protein